MPGSVTRDNWGLDGDPAPDSNWCVNPALFTQARYLAAECESGSDSEMYERTEVYLALISPHYYFLFHE